MKTLDSALKNYLDTNFKVKEVEYGIHAEHVTDKNKWIKLLKDGTAKYCYGDEKDVLDFNSYEECLDFIMI